MTREEAKQALEEGHKISHKSFLEDEWIKTIHIVTIQTQDNFLINQTAFWRCRKDPKFDTEWFIWKQPEQQYYISTGGYVGNALVLWRENSRGYTSNFDDAGKYSETEAKEICRNSNRNEKAIPVDLAEKFILRTINLEGISDEEYARITNFRD